ncbi:HGxxPAAW family protein [Pengzhenrongella sicca]|uniref:Uncharacterized protein n=1 Tax=Pengzhenrongella sicca TaxID=2819238 RepID=A0A8A4ZJV0_9MICO|nr:HGxxPAAW family protein [Pengzhenrongella sicca]QTE30786.1 hypothetical protein J4E96_07575 [Pengzhenrongella sicca]
MVDQSAEHSAPAAEIASLPPSAPWANHGRTIAAWTTVTVVLVGGTIAAVAVLLAMTWLFWAGLVVVVVGIVIGKILQMAGYGQGGANTLARQERARAAGRGH